MKEFNSIQQYFDEVIRIWSKLNLNYNIIPFCTPIFKNPSVLVIGQNHAMNFDLEDEGESDRIIQRFSEQIPSENTFKDHNQKFNEGNLLTRGQTVEGVPENEIKSIELKAGQMSLHHPRIVHGSGINKSNDRRIGFVVQSYIGTNVKQTLGKNSVQIARGEDKYHHHEIINRTNTIMSEESILLRKKENDFMQEIFYKGANQKGSY